nr:immunoglobulin heavy chain junction region [Mus musculus]
CARSGLRRSYYFDYW